MSAQMKREKSILPNTEKVSSKHKENESVWRYEGNLCAHIFFLIFSPEDCTGCTWEYKTKPHEYRYTKSRSIWDTSHEKREDCHHEKRHEKLYKKESPHTIGRSFNISFSIVVDFHPDSSKNRAIPNSSRHPRKNTNSKYSYPVDRRNILWHHRKKEKK